jgi:hypothetical protein
LVPDTVVVFWLWTTLLLAASIASSSATTSAASHTCVCCGGDLQVMGLEGVTIEFPATEYKGHFKEEGYNGGEALKTIWRMWL